MKGVAGNEMIESIIESPHPVPLKPGYPSYHCLMIQSKTQQELVILDIREFIFVCYQPWWLILSTKIRKRRRELDTTGIWPPVEGWISSAEVCTLPPKREARCQTIVSGETTAARRGLCTVRWSVPARVSFTSTQFTCVRRNFSVARVCVCSGYWT